MCLLATMNRECSGRPLNESDIETFNYLQMQLMKERIRRLFEMKKRKFEMSIVKSYIQKHFPESQSFTLLLRRRRNFLIYQIRFRTEGLYQKDENVQVKE